MPTLHYISRQVHTRTYTYHLYKLCAADVQNNIIERLKTNARRNRASIIRRLGVGHELCVYLN